MLGMIHRWVWVAVLVIGLAQVVHAQAPVEDLSLATWRTIAQRLLSNLDAAAQKTIEKEPIHAEESSEITFQSVRNSNQRGLRVSATTITLVNRLSLALAINRLDRGYLQSYLDQLAKFSGTDKVPELPPSKVKMERLDLVNEHLSNFNQISAGLIAIALSHLPSDSNPPTGDQWFKALRKGINISLPCAYGTEGLVDFFEALEKLPSRPSWVESFYPTGIKTRKVRREIDRINHDLLR